MTRCRALVAALLVVAALAGGCGGDDDDVETLSEADFLEQANAICTEGNGELEAAVTDAFGEGEPTPAEIKAFMDGTMIPSIRDQIDAIRDLGAPDEIDGGADSFLAAVDAQLDELGDMTADDMAGFMVSGEDPFAEVNAMGVDLGLAECGSTG